MLGATMHHHTLTLLVQFLEEWIALLRKRQKDDEEMLKWHLSHLVNSADRIPKDTLNMYDRIWALSMNPLEMGNLTFKSRVLS